jgi:hypothetical protein
MPDEGWAKAEAHYRRAVEFRPCDPWVHARLGYVLATGPAQAAAEAARHYQLARQLAHPQTNPDELENLENNLQLLQQRAGVTHQDPVAVPPLCEELRLRTE